MTLLDALLILCALIGFGAAAFLVARSPVFWVGFGKALFKELLPFFLGIFKPASPEKLKKINDAYRRGEEWPPRKK